MSTTYKIQVCPKAQIPRCLLGETLLELKRLLKATSPSLHLIREPH